MSEMFAENIQALKSSQEGALDAAVEILSSDQEYFKRPFGSCCSAR